MRLVLQCSVCGTIQTVGSAACGTCLASGLKNLRLLFECQKCFGLSLNVSCEICSGIVTLNLADPLREGTSSLITQGTWEIVSDDDSKSTEWEEVKAEHLPSHRLELDEEKNRDETGDGALSREDLPVAELLEEELRPEEEPDSLVKDE